MSIPTVAPISATVTLPNPSLWSGTYRARHRENVPSDSAHTAECECEGIIAAEAWGGDSPDNYRAPLATWACPAHEPVRYSRDSARHYGTPTEGWVK